MPSSPTPTNHGWGNVILDAVIAWLLPSVASTLLRLVLADGATLVGVLLAVQLLAFYLIGKVRGRSGLTAHLAKVAGLMALLSLALSGGQLGEWLIGLPVLVACAALGGWTGSRGRDERD
jgi:hypothetical protein